MSIVSLALLWPTTAGAQDRAAPDRPVLVAGRPAPELHGVWRSRGYGYIVRFDRDGRSLFHVAGDYCYPGETQESATGVVAGIRRAFDRIRSFAGTFIHILRPKRNPDDMFALYRPIGPSIVAFSAEPGQTRYVFDRIGEVPSACTDKTPWTAPRIAGLVAATFADLYPSFGLRGIDWP
jgi:carboxyl-terminal processing protease